MKMMWMQLFAKKGETMGIKKFINNVVDFLDLDKFSVEGKKKSIKKLLVKLEKREERLKKIISKEHDKKAKKRLKEELAIAQHQIKKAKKHLVKLSK